MAQKIIEENHLLNNNNNIYDNKEEIKNGADINLNKENKVINDIDINNIFRQKYVEPEIIKQKARMDADNLISEREKDNKIINNKNIKTKKNNSLNKNKIKTKGNNIDNLVKKYHLDDDNDLNNANGQNRLKINNYLVINKVDPKEASLKPKLYNKKD